METPSRYRTLKNSSTGEYKEKGSKFLAYASPVMNLNNIEAALQKLKSLHPKARHHCYAWRMIDHKQVIEKANDAGEPSGTAGRPILGQIVKFELFHVLVIVVRYFGGTKLGTSGLVRAYKSATLDALQHAHIDEVQRYAHYRLQLDFVYQPKLHSETKILGIKVSDLSYSEKINCKLSVPLQDHQGTLLHLFQKMSGFDFDGIEGYIIRMGMSVDFAGAD